MTKRIDISHKTILFIAFFLLGLWVTYLILDLLLLLFVALIFSSAISPVVRFFERFKLPKAFGVLASYLIVILSVSGLLFLFLPPLIEQTVHLITTLPPMLAEKFNYAGFDRSLFQSEIADLSRRIYGFVLGLFSNALAMIFLLVLTFYLTLEKSSLQDRIAKLFIGQEDRIKHLFVRIEEKLGSWLRGQLMLTVIIGVTTYTGLTILQIPYALPLALIAGVMEVVPVIGPIISSLPAIGLAFTISPILAGGVAAMYFVIQQLENHIIVPQVMKRAVGLNPLVVILAIAVGGRLLGVVGGVLAVPITVVAQVIIGDFIDELKKGAQEG